MRIVVKVGTSTLTHATGRMDIRHVETLCKVLSDVKNAGYEIVLVSSGAIGMGVGKLNLRERPADMPGKQAAAAVGQCELMYVYDKLFNQYNHTIAQILLTGEDLRDDARHQNFSNTVGRLLELGVLPVINENDTVSTAEIAVGDNDTLGALVAESVHADLLIVLTDIDGLYTADPRRDAQAKLIPEVREITPQMRESLVSLFESYRAHVHIVYLETEWDTLMERNSNRDEAVPTAEIEKMLAKLTPPEPREAKIVEWLYV